MKDEHMRQRRNLMLITTLLLFIELVGVEVGSVSLLNINFKLSRPEYIKPILFSAFVFVLTGYLQHFFYEGCGLLKAAYQKSVDCWIDKICYKGLRQIQDTEAMLKYLELHERPYLTLKDMIGSRSYRRPTVQHLRRDTRRLADCIWEILEGKTDQDITSLVGYVTKQEILWLQTKSGFATVFLRPEGYTHLWPLLYAVGMGCLYALSSVDTAP